MYYHLIKVSLAAHASLFLVKLKTIALGEFIPYDKISNKVSEKLQTDFNPNFSESGFMNEMGSTFIIAACLILLTAVLLLLGLLRKKLNATFTKLIDKVKATLFWNAFIRYSLQAYLQIGFASMPVLIAYSQHSVFKILYASANILMLLTLPVFYSVLL